MWSRLSNEAAGGVVSAGADHPSLETAVAPEARPAANSNLGSELALVKAVIAGDPMAARRFVDQASAALWSVVVKLEGDGTEGEAAFLHVVTLLKADGFARLKAFDRRARLSTYLALVARDILSDRLARSFSEAPGEAWQRFVRFFERDIRRRVTEQFPRNIGLVAQEDAFQEVCLKLIEGDFHRIRAYGGRGSFVGYVLTVVDRILIDLVRRDAPRRRLPAAVARLSLLDQEVYMAIAWQACPLDAARIAAMLRGRLEQEPSSAEVSAALERIAGVARLHETAQSRRTEIVSLDSITEGGGGVAIADPAPSPEDQLLLAEEERGRAVLVAAVKAAAADLPADEKLYLQTIFSVSEPLSAGEIARLMGYPVGDVYRLKQRAQRWIKDVAVQLVKNSDQSV